MNSLSSVAVIGGTGDLGSGLAWRLSRQGYRVVIGSRTPSKAEEAVARLAELGAPGLTAMDNVEAARAGQLCFVTVPFAHQRGTLEQIRDAVQGKIVVDTTVPLMPPKIMRVQLPPEGSAGKAAQEILGDQVRLVSAFHNVAAAHLIDTETHADEGDVLVFGNDEAAREQIVQLAGQIGFRAWHAGVIDNSAVAEAMTSVLIFMNKRYRIPGAGIRITGAPATDSADQPPSGKAKG